MTKVSPVMSPVDYDAWSRGYLPPTEHVLIDELQFRGARVMAASHSEKSGYWLVVKGSLSRAARRKIIMFLTEQMEAALDEDVPQAPEATSGEGDTKIRVNGEAQPSGVPLEAWPNPTPTGEQG